MCVAFVRGSDSKRNSISKSDGLLANEEKNFDE